MLEVPRTKNNTHTSNLDSTCSPAWSQSHKVVFGRPLLVNTASQTPYLSLHPHSTSTLPSSSFSIPNPVLIVYCQNIRLYASGNAINRLRQSCFSCKIVALQALMVVGCLLTGCCCCLCCCFCCNCCCGKCKPHDDDEYDAEIPPDFDVDATTSDNAAFDNVSVCIPDQ